GTHEGHQHFTIGQRKGVGVARGVPLFVIDIDPASSRITVGTREQTLRRTRFVDQVNLLADRFGGGEWVTCSAKIRYNHTPQPCRARLSEAGELVVAFDETQSAITPGQAVVLYDDACVLGGGWIRASEP